MWLRKASPLISRYCLAEHYKGRDAFVDGLKRVAASSLILEKQSPALAVLHNNLSDMKNVLNRLIYQKGGWTLHMLRSDGYGEVLGGNSPLLSTTSGRQRFDRRFSTNDGRKLRTGAAGSFDNAADSRARRLKAAGATTRRPGVSFLNLHNHKPEMRIGCLSKLASRLTAFQRSKGLS